MSEGLARDANAAGYEARAADFIVEAVATIVRQVAEGRRLDLIDIGGGDGYLFDRLRPSVQTYVNVEPGDIELSGVAAQRLRDPTYAALRCSAEEMPLYDGSADLVIAVASMDHVPRPHRALAEARRCLRPGGHLILTMNNRRSWWKALLGGTGYLRRREARIATEHTVLWSLVELRGHVAEHFEIVSARSIVHFPYAPVVWRALLPISNVLGRRLLPRLGGHSIVVGRAH